MRTGVVIIALCAVSYGDPAVFHHDKTVACGYIGVIEEQPLSYCQAGKRFVAFYERRN